MMSQVCHCFPLYNTVAMNTRVPGFHQDRSVPDYHTVLYSSICLTELDEHPHYVH